MDADALQKLADDIEANGLKVPVERRLTKNGLYVIERSQPTRRFGIGRRPACR